MKPVILTLTNCYPPGFRGGGPMRSILGLQERLRDEFDIRVVTLDRDRGDLTPFPSVKVGAWQALPQGPVLYLPPPPLLIPALARTLRETRHDVIYVNSLFCPWLGVPPVFLRHMTRDRNAPLLVAPRGQLSKGALGISPKRKQAFLAVARRSRLYRGAHWHATALEDADEIRRWFGRDVRVWVASDLTDIREPAALPRPPKQRGRLRLAFLSRIVPKKNLVFAVQVLAAAGGDISLDVWGPVEDPSYRAEVERVARTSGSNAPLRFCGEVKPEEVCSTLSRYDAFLFPTLGENFGHVVLEALLAGCPVILSDRTPWSDVETTGSGWTLPLEDPRQWVDVLRRLAADDGTLHASMSRHATTLARAHLASDHDVEANRVMIRGVLAARRG